MSTSNSSSGRIGFAGLLTLLFIALKLLKVISWSWWWVMSPLLISTGLCLLVLVVIGVIAVVLKR